MSVEIKKEIELKIAHVLFMDIVGYSKLAINEQRASVETLNEIVRRTDEFQRAEAAGRLIKIPTGDGMALVFYDSPEEPVECALEISRALKGHPQFLLRMGIHSGPVSGVIDVNDRANVAGAGINMAQRIMDCGDAGHVLLSRHVAEDLEQFPHWKPHLHEIGECIVKHGVRAHVTNLYTGELGNSEQPTKFKAMLKSRRAKMAVGSILIAGMFAALFFFHRLASPTPGMSGIPEKSIAVLPFENLSEDKANAYFAAGIQDEILTRLANVSQLKMISGTSTEKYQSHPQNLRTVGVELGVANVLEGSVQRLVNDVHINVQLIKVSSDTHIWAQSYDRILEHAFAVEGEVAQTVANSLKVALLPAEVEKINALPTQNAHAYDVFLKGQYALEQAWKNPGDYQQAFPPAMTSFQEAVAADPRFSLAFAQLAQTQLTKFHFGLLDGGSTRMPELVVSAKQNIDRALELDPNLAAAHVALGRWHSWAKADFDAGRTEFQRAIALEPGLSDALLGLGSIALRQGHPEETIDYLSKGLMSDPRNFQMLRTLAIAHSMRREYTEAIEVASRAVALDPTDEVDAFNLSQDIISGTGDLSAAHRVLDAYLSVVSKERQNSSGVVEWKLSLLEYGRDFEAAKKFAESVPAEGWRTNSDKPETLGDIYHALGEEEAARASFQEARKLLAGEVAKDPDEPQTHASLANVDAALGLSDEALAEAQRAIDLQPIEKNTREGSQWAANLAVVNARLGRAAQAVEMIERLLATPNTGEALSLWELKLDPTWDSLRTDDRFARLLASSPTKPQ